MLSTVCTSSSGPPSTSDALILLVPCPGISTQESRGMPMIVALCLSGLIETTWIESASECSMSSPRRAPLPTTRSTIGLFPVSDGAYPAWALPITSPACADAGATAPSVPSAEPATHATSAVTASTARRRTLTTGSPSGSRRAAEGLGVLHLVVAEHLEGHDPPVPVHLLEHELPAAGHAHVLAVLAAAHGLEARDRDHRVRLVLQVEQHLRLQHAGLRQDLFERVAGSGPRGQRVDL